MTVKEFIDKLSKFNQDDEVYIEYCRPYEVTIIYTDVNDEVVYNEEDNLIAESVYIVINNIASLLGLILRDDL